MHVTVQDRAKNSPSWQKSILRLVNWLDEAGKSLEDVPAFVHVVEAVKIKQPFSTRRSLVSILLSGFHPL